MALNRKVTVVLTIATCAFVLLSAWLVIAARGQEAPAPGHDGPVIVYEIELGDAQRIATQLGELYRGKAVIVLDESLRRLLVRASKDTQAEIEGVVKVLDNAPPPEKAASAAGAAGAKQDDLLVRRGYATANALEPPAGHGIVSLSSNGGFVHPSSAFPFTLDCSTCHSFAPREPDSPDQNSPAGLGGSLSNLDRNRDAVLGYLSMQISNREQIDAAVKGLRDAESDADKQTARVSLRRLLAEIFERDMQDREEQVTEIESRLGTLRRQYQERVRGKDQIIDLQVQVVENDAAGLGFPGVGAASSSPQSNRAIGQSLEAYAAEVPAGQSEAPPRLPDKFVVEEAVAKPSPKASN